MRSSRPVAERRLVSVLFADLVGFTEISETRDPEAVRDLLTTYFEVARQTIQLYGGTIEKFIGDAVMAVWGTPVPQEDDAERAVRAALDLVGAVQGIQSEAATPSSSPAGLRLRAAVVTGEAAVTLGAEGQGMVAGDLVNTASRVQSLAPRGGVCHRRNPPGHGRIHRLRGGRQPRGEGQGRTGPPVAGYSGRGRAWGCPPIARAGGAVRGPKSRVAADQAALPCLG